MKAAVVLAGCGVMDGAEIHEAVMTLYAIDKTAEATRYCPECGSAPCHKPHNREVMKESRNVLTEAARIARGKIKALTEYRAESLMLSYSRWIRRGQKPLHLRLRRPDCHVDRVVEQAIRATHRQANRSEHCASHLSSLQKSS
jgi:enhancing lycopene biosynthesis protein 2